MTTRTDLGIRAICGDGALELRANTSGGRTMFGHFARFGDWYEVNSTREGRFLERIAPGTFDQAFNEKRSQIRVMWEHGQDPTVGSKPLGSIVELSETRDGPYYEVELFDAQYVNDLIPAIESEQTGASWRFSVPSGGDVWEDRPRASDHNPDRLPERTIQGADVYEFGPVVWGANVAATSGVRSGTDAFLEHLLNDPLFVARFTERAGLKVVERMISTSADGDETPPSEETVDDQSEEQRTRRIEAIQARLDAFRSHSTQGDQNV